MAATSTSVMIKDVRLSFPTLAKAESYNNGAPRFSASFHIEKGSDNHKAILEAMLACAKDKWGAKGEAELKACMANTQRCCLQPGVVKKLDDSLMVLSAHNKADRPPSLFQGNRDAVRGESEIMQTFYAGCYVNAKITLWAQDNVHGKALRASINGIQFNRHGEPFTSNTAANADDFETVEVATALPMDDIGGLASLM